MSEPNPAQEWTAAVDARNATRAKTYALGIGEGREIEKSLIHEQLKELGLIIAAAMMEAGMSDEQTIRELPDCVHGLKALLVHAREQLAAERRKYDALVGRSDEVIEIDKHGNVHRPKSAPEIEIHQLRSQLAVLVDALKECRVKLDWSLCDGGFLEKIDAALAATKEGK